LRKNSIRGEKATTGAEQFGEKVGALTSGAEAQVKTDDLSQR
jgi:hypothetical protein